MLPARAADPVPNPYLSAPKYAVTHFDSAQTDAFPYPAPTGTRNVSALLPVPLLQVPQVPAGPINIMTLASTSPNYMWGVSTTGVSYISTAGGSFKAVARAFLPGLTQTLSSTLNGLLTAPVATLQQAQSIVNQITTSLPLAGGLSSAYNVVDLDNVLYVNYGKKVYAFALLSPTLPALGIQIIRTLDATTFLQSDEQIAGIVMTYDGNLVVLGTHSATIVSRSFTGPTHTVQFNSDESISNSAAVDENNGIYIVTDKLMRKVVWTGTTLSQSSADGAWSSPYPTGDTYPTLFGSGSGSTPTLMGFNTDTDKLVVITDGLKRMSLMAFWRDAIPPGFTDRIAGTIQVNCGLPAAYEIQTDQSVAVDGYGAFVVNNVSSADGSTGSGNIAVDGFLARGPLVPSPVGVERFAWNPQTHAWSSTWARADVSSNTMVPGISSTSHIVFVNGYYQSTGWEVTGLDWSTGVTVHRTIFGPGILGNGLYALIEFLPNGDLIFNSVIGPTRVTMPSGVILPPPLL
ncbi:hypothetical protein YK56LOC_13820 [Caballeronia sp. HLA56]